MSAHGSHMECVHSFVQLLSPMFATLLLVISSELKKLWALIKNIFSAFLHRCLCCKYQFKSTTIILILYYFVERDLKWLWRKDKGRQEEIHISQTYDEGERRWRRKIWEFKKIIWNNFYKNETLPWSEFFFVHALPHHNLIPTSYLHFTWPI